MVAIVSILDYSNGSSDLMKLFHLSQFLFSLLLSLAFDRFHSNFSTFNSFRWSHLIPWDSLLGCLHLINFHCSTQRYSNTSYMSLLYFAFTSYFPVHTSWRAKETTLEILLILLYVPGRWGMCLLQNLFLLINLCYSIEEVKTLLYLVD